MVEIHESTAGTAFEVGVREDDAGDARIRAFLATHESATLAHDPAWAEILSRGLGHRAYYLEARRGDRTVGVLPLAYVNTFLFGRFLVSLPYLNHAGPIADDSTTVRRLVDEAVALADRLDVRYLELRNRAEIEHPKLTEQRTSKVLMWRELPSTADELWKSFKPEVRNQVRKGRKHDFDVTWGGTELIDEFHAVFSRNMRDLGTPVFAKELFSSMLAGLGDRGELCVLRKQAEPVSAALLLHAEGVTEVPSASSLREYNKTCANMLMYHHLLLRAQERGQRWFDFGRSSEESGTHRFKRQWGATPSPLVWQYYARRGDVSEVRPDNPKYRWRIETWKRLPLWLTRLIGPLIVRGIP